MKPSVSGARAHPSTARTMPVKKELEASRPDPDREARIRAMAAKIRAEARSKAGLVPEDGDGVEDTPRLPTHPSVKSKAEAPKAFGLGSDLQDTSRLEALLPVLEKTVSGAEEETEKVSIVAAPLAMEASEALRSVQTGAIRDTEKAVRVAIVAIAAARKDVEHRSSEVRAFAANVRAGALDEIQRFRARIDAAAAKVEEFKHVRRDYDQALVAENMFGELATRLTSIEIDCERAAMMAEPLVKAFAVGADTMKASDIRESREAVRLVQATLAPTTRLISGKVAGLKGIVRKKMQDLLDRAEAAQSLLDKAQQTVDEAQSRAAAVPMLREASACIEKVEEALQEMRETEAPFLMGIEVMPADEADEILQRMQKAASHAQCVCADAHKSVSLKLVEVGRFAEGAASSAKRELERARQQVDAGRERVLAFLEDLGKRRRQNLVVQVKDKVEEAENSVLRMKELGAELLLLDGSNISEAVERGLAAELEAQHAVAAARRELQHRQQQLRSSEGSSPDATKDNGELLRIRVRIQYLESEISKFRKSAKTLEERLKVTKSLAATSSLLEEAEAEVARLAEVAGSRPDDERPPDDIQTTIVGVQKKLTSTTTQVEMKLHTAQGLELKELRIIFGRLQKAQGKLDSVKELVRNRTRAISGRIVHDSSDRVRKAESKVATICSESAKTDLSVERLGDLCREAGSALAAVATVVQTLGDHEHQGVLVESKVDFARLQLRCKALQRKCQSAVERLAARLHAAVEEAQVVALDALRLAAQVDHDRYDADRLFERLSEGTGKLSEEQFCDFLAQAQPELDMDKARAAYRQIAPCGLERSTFVAALGLFLRVTRDVSMTDEFDVQNSKTLCKLVAGEVVEALGGVREDSSSGLARLRVRLVRDGTVGWVTMRTSRTAGTSFLERTSKPYLWCAQAISLREMVESSSRTISHLVPGDVIELLEGPHEENLTADRRVRGVACHEDSLGWLQVSDVAGRVLAEVRSNLFKCSEAIAMTDIADFSTCAMVRRLDRGEILELLGDAEVAPTEGGKRKRFRACRDGREGWVTVEGNQGTIYVHQVERHYLCTQATPLHSGLGAETPVVRILMPGEAFAAHEEPREVSGGDRVKLFRVRCEKADHDGWLTASVQQEVVPWTRTYKVLRPTPLTSTFAANEAAEPVEVARFLEAGEFVQLMEPPKEDHSTGQLRARCTAVRDQAIGWATAREAANAGAALLMQPAPPEEVQQAANVRAGDAAPSTPPARGAQRGLQVKEEHEEDVPWARYPKGKGKGSEKGKGKHKR